MEKFSDNELDGILDLVDKGTKERAKDMDSNNFSNRQTIENFVNVEYDQRLDSLLQQKGSSIHSLESATKTKINLRKQNTIDRLNDDLLR